MELAEDLYVAENISDLETIVYALRRNIPVARLYCIVFFGERNCFELLSSRELFTGKFHNSKGKIVGVALGAWEVRNLFCYMIEEVSKGGKDLTDPKTWIEETADEVVL